MKTFRPTNRIQLLLTLLTTLMLTACGGGGGSTTPPDGGSTTPPDGGGTTPPANKAPTVSTSSDVTKREGDNVTFTATASDPDGDAVTVAWAQTAGPDLGQGNKTGTSLSFTLPNVASNTSYTFEATASDGKTSAKDSVTVTSSANQAPTLSVTAPDTLNELQNVSVTASASDPDGDEVSYHWEVVGTNPGIELSGSSTETAGFTTPIIDVATAAGELRVTATDNATYPMSITETVSASIAQGEIIIFQQDTAEGSNLYQVDTDGNRRLLYASDTNFKVDESAYPYSISPNRKMVAVTLDNRNNLDNEKAVVIDLQTLAVSSIVPPGAQSNSDVSKELAWSPDSTTIAYRTDPTVDNVYELVVANADGSNIRIGATPFVDKRNSGSTLRFRLGSDNCWDTDPDCSDTTDMPSGDVQDFKWSPDSSRIAFRLQPTPDIGLELHSVELATDEITTLSDLFVEDLEDCGGFCAAFPYWEADAEYDPVTPAAGDGMPDGVVNGDYQWMEREGQLWIAYRSNERRNNLGMADAVWVVDAAGNQRQQLAPIVGMAAGSKVMAWEWSPDGQYLAWEDHAVGAATAQRLLISPFEPGVPTDVPGSLLAMTAGGHQLPDGSMGNAGFNAVIERFSWSPDSQYIAFRGVVRRAGVTELYIVDRDPVDSDLNGVPDSFAVPGNLFRDQYTNDAYDGVFYPSGSDGEWDTDCLLNSAGISIAGSCGADTLPDGYVSGDFAWNETGTALHFHGDLRMRLLSELYRWNIGDTDFTVLSNMTRDENINAGVFLNGTMDGIADSADTTGEMVGIPQGRVVYNLDSATYWTGLPGSGASEAVVYIADERWRGMYELWLSQPDGDSLLLSDLMHDGDDANSLPDNDLDGDGFPNSWLVGVLPLGGTRLLYLSGEASTFADPSIGDFPAIQVVFIDAADPASTRKYLSEAASAGNLNSITKVTVAFPNGRQASTVVD